MSRISPISFGRRSILKRAAGRRPALVLSPRIYNAKSGLALVCPITNQATGYPFEVPVPATRSVSGAILADHVKSVDWKVRRAEKWGDARVERSTRFEPGWRL
jgi:mRNA interferase MazF